MNHLPTTRREFFRKTSAAAAAIGASAAALDFPAAIALEPIKRQSATKLKLSLAAYSFRSLLPNYRGGKPATNPKLDMAGFVQYCAGLGLDGTEITSYFLPHPCPDEVATALKRQAHLLGIDISGGAIGNNFSHGPGDKLDGQMKYTTEWIKTYSLMGAPVIRVFAGNPAGSKLSAEQAEKNIVTNLKSACKIAARHGVMLAMENHDFTTDIDRFLRIVEAVDSPWFGANLDTGNLAKTPDPYKEIARIAPFSINAQVKVHIPVNGKKEPVDFERIVKILRDANYRGYVVLEYEDSEDPYKAVPRYIETLRKLID